MRRVTVQTKQTVCPPNLRRRLLTRVAELHMSPYRSAVLLPVIARHSIELKHSIQENIVAMQSEKTSDT